MKINIDYKFYKTLFAISIPISIQSLITSLLNMIDTFMISSLDSSSIAGVGAANKVFFLLNLFLFGTSSGAAILAAQYWGNKDTDNIKRVLGVSLIIGLSGALIMSLFAIVLPSYLMRIFTPEKNVIDEGVKYLRIIGWSYFFTTITFVFAFLLRTIHQVKLPMIITVISITINTFLNWILIYGNLGAPALGVQGAAIATVTARIIECFTLVTLVYKMNLPIAAKIHEMVNFSQKFLSKYFKTVTPVILNEIIWSLGVTGYALIYGRMGEEVMASITITQTIEQLAFVAFHGLGSSAAVMLGNELGADKLSRALKYSNRFLRISIIIAVIISLILFSLSDFISGIFQVEPEVRVNIFKCLQVFCIYLPLKSINMIIIVGVLRSGGDTIASMFIDMIGVWAVGIPMGILGGLILGLSIEYVYAMILLEELIKSIIAYIRMKQKKWIKNLTIEKISAA